MYAETQYLNILDKILKTGTYQENRTGIGCYYIFGESIRHDYNSGFPLITTKKIFTKGVIVELLWFLKGTEDPKFLLDNNVHIWDEWIKDGKLSHTYGVKWRNFYGVDQIKRLISEIKINPTSRRHVVSSWDAANVDNAVLPWCHVLFQIDVNVSTNEISMMVFQRSCDWFLGVPFNICSYSLLLYMIAEIVGYKPKYLYYTFGNCHVYKNHVEQCRLQLSRNQYKFPELKLNHKDDIDDFVLGDFSFEGYNFHPTIKAEVAI